jgi:N-acetylglucosamine-6-sulfatase
LAIPEEEERKIGPRTMIVALLFGSVVGLLAAKDAVSQAEAPNILYVVVDDADAENMERYMLRTKAVVKDQGVSFSGFYIAQPLCCPSRSSALLGEYPHNHHVEGNNLPWGGWHKFRREGHEARTIGVQMKGSDYTTGFFGKYLNHYENTHSVPKSWENWFGKWGQKYYDWSATNTNGSIDHFGTAARAFSDKVVLKKAAEWSSTQTTPFFAYVSLTAPHAPYSNPPGDAGATQKDYVPSPAFDEKDVSDKPSYVRNLPQLSGQDRQSIEQRHRGRAKLTEYLDTQIADAINALEAAGKLENTYVVVTSDNGWMEGEHRIRSEKGVPYEESSHLPLWIRGPGILPGAVVDEPASNVDLFATFSDMAGEPELRDGISLLGLAQGNATTDRQRVLIEGRGHTLGSYDAIYDVSHGRKL